MAAASDNQAWWLKPLSECQRELNPDSNGLSDAEALSRLSK
jgi:Mg2+-importing ATPase